MQSQDVGRSMVLWCLLGAMSLRVLAMTGPIGFWRDDGRTTICGVPVLDTHAPWDTSQVMRPISHCHILKRPVPLPAALKRRGACGPRMDIDRLPDGIKGLRFRKQVHVDPRRKIAFCPIPKVASLQFISVVNALGGFNGTHDCCCGWEPPRPGGTGAPKKCYSDSHAGRFNLTRSDVHADSAWKLAVFVRDPFERLLSGYLYQCCRGLPYHELQGTVCLSQQWNYVSPDVCREDAPLEHKVIHFAHFLASHALRDFQDLMRDSHLKPQSIIINDDCGFSFDRIDFVGYLSRDREDTRRQVQEMLLRFGAGSHMSRALSEEFFHSGYYSKYDLVQAHEMGAHKMMEAFRNNSMAMELATRFLRRDYEKLRSKLRLVSG